MNTFTKIKWGAMGFVCLASAVTYVGFGMPGAEQTGVGKVLRIGSQTVSLKRKGTTVSSHDEWVYNIQLAGQDGEVPLALMAPPRTEPQFQVGQDVQLTWRKSGLFGKNLGLRATAMR